MSVSAQSYVQVYADPTLNPCSGMDTHHLRACSIAFVLLPLLSIQAIEDDKLRDIEDGEPLPGSLCLYPMEDLWLQKVHLDNGKGGFSSTELTAFQKP